MRFTPPNLKGRTPWNLKDVHDGSPPNPKGRTPWK